MKESAIFVNQTGYLPDDSKTAFVADSCRGGAQKFIICDAQSGKEVFSGRLIKAPDDDSAGEQICWADFSSFKQCGTFFVCVRDGKNVKHEKKVYKSFAFKIGPDVYDELLHSTLRYFTDSRCGQGVCHTGTAEVYGSSIGKCVEVQGGWHDAGDYGRYVVAGTKAVMDLLLAYKAFPERFASGFFNLVSEVKFELDWLLQMQREDGAVYHKISCYNFCGFIRPEDEKEPLVLSPVSTAATADFAGCLAYAAVFFKQKDVVQKLQELTEAETQAFAQKLLQAAIKAQNYLFAHDDEIYLNPPEITTGSYGDKNVSDERYFALCSLFAATGDENYLNHAMKIRQTKQNQSGQEMYPWRKDWFESYGWAYVTGYGTELLLQNAEKIRNKAIVEEMKNSFLKTADKLLENVQKSAFKYSSKFVLWGSNGCICDMAHVLLIAHELSDRQEYLEAAKAQLDFILGCNPLNYCYITGAGKKSPVKPHHRPSCARGSVFPGMLVGGPFDGLEDAYAKEHLTGLAPLKCYVDHEACYSTNEVAIYWNSAFVYLLTKLLATKKTRRI